MARKYHTLCILEDGVWGPQFGDYDKAVVEQEREDGAAAKFYGEAIMHALACASRLDNG